MIEMDLETLQKGYPNIDPKALYELFPRIPVMDYPDLSEYSWEACHRGSLGGEALFLASEMAQELELAAGMHVLDLGCGHAASSMFLARQHGVSVIAED